MPWHIEEGHPECPASRPYGVVKDDDASLEGCHESRNAAQDQMAALYASEDRGKAVEKHVALFEVKALADGDPNGEFEAVLSVPVIDRDGEVVAARAFEPLPAEIPIHKFHNFSQPVATAVPFYDGDVLKARGVFDPDPDSQAIRSKIGRSIRYMSVGFMAPSRETIEGVPHITKAELLEASFVSVPSNREAAILAVKAAMPQTPEATAMVPAMSTASTTWNGSVTYRSAAEIDLRQELAHIKQLLEQLAAPEGAAEKSPDTDPEDEAAAPAAADPPADVIAGHVRLAALRAQTLLLQGE